MMMMVQWILTIVGESLNTLLARMKSKIGLILLRNATLIFWASLPLQGQMLKNVGALAVIRA